MDFSLKLKQETKLVLTQEMKISMNILQMSSSQLREYLEKEATINPAIEISYSTFSTKGVSEEEYSPLDFVTKEETLIDYLEEQIGYLQLSKKIKKICIFIVNNLDSRGYLAISKVELKKLLKINMQELNEAFEIIYTLDPIGIGAENLKDCLKIQLRNKGIYDEKLFTLIEYYLEEVANQNYSIIAQELKIDENKILDYIKLIKTLTPIPARGYRIDTTSNYVVPEAKIEVKNGELVFKINEGVIPKVSVNSYYSESLASDKKFINTAINIVKCLEKRYQTLTKILEFLIKKQRDYFFRGENFLHTLILKDIATELNLHESTISRAIKDKYLDTPQGTISIKSLFIIDSKKIKIKKIIEELINKENKKNPISDERISIYLKDKGYIVARRTVTKYREELGFGSTRDRKK